MTNYKTLVVNVPASPLGLLAVHWKIEHWCTLCHREVATQDLITHAQDHAATADDDNA